MCVNKTYIIQLYVFIHIISPPWIHGNLLTKLHPFQHFNGTCFKVDDPTFLRRPEPEHMVVLHLEPWKLGWKLGGNIPFPLSVFWVRGKWDWDLRKTRLEEPSSAIRKPGGANKICHQWTPCRYDKKRWKRWPREAPLVNKPFTRLFVRRFSLHNLHEFIIAWTERTSIARQQCPRVIKLHPSRCPKSSTLFFCHVDK